MIDIAFDGLCVFCRRSVRVLRVLDLRRRLVFHDSTDRKLVLRQLPALAGADLDAAMWALTRGRTYRGFYAFRRIAWAVPPLWPLVPLLHLPGVSVVGERVYDWVARNRSQLGCRVGGPDG